MSDTENTMLAITQPAKDQYERKIDKLAKRIQTLEAERRWVPVSERLPEEYKQVIVYAANFGGIILYDGMYMDDGELVGWCRRGEDYPQLDVTHWMPLPEPPATDSEGEK